MNFNTVESWYPPSGNILPSMQHQTVSLARSVFPVPHHVVPVMGNASVKVAAKNRNATRASLPTQQRTKAKKAALLSSPERKEEKRAQDRNSQRNFRQRQKDIMAWQEAKITELQAKVDISEQREYQYGDVIERQRLIIWQQNQIIAQQDTKLEKLGSTFLETATAMSSPTIQYEYTPDARHQSAIPFQTPVYEIVPSVPYADMGSGSARVMAYPAGSDVVGKPAAKQESVLNDFSGVSTTDSDGSDAAVFQDSFWEHEWARYGYGQDSVSSSTES
ncbi:hypothetical protein NQ176_g1464 [Zarea fungicola]|uniref:Uncharacterized protein n=1 Tax=Zarea fungicola TaxID=93591 RepID=A0ACC1NT65_9HYPO|nr:hypothetical protein NQ176_g1464 [Lecanicillium fungicola]